MSEKMKSLKFSMFFRVCLEDSRLPLARLEQRICRLPSARYFPCLFFPNYLLLISNKGLMLPFSGAWPSTGKEIPLHQAPACAKHLARCVTYFSHLILTTINYTK